MSAGEFAMQSIIRLVSGASDEEWLTLIGQLSRAENPGQVFFAAGFIEGAAAP
jgi:hypothetical protein